MTAAEHATATAAEVAEWLNAETPEGVTIAEMVRAIITDAYNEAIECNS